MVAVSDDNDPKQKDEREAEQQRQRQRQTEPAKTSSFSQVLRIFSVYDVETRMKKQVIKTCFDAAANDIRYYMHMETKFESVQDGGIARNTVAVYVKLKSDKHGRLLFNNIGSPIKEVDFRGFPLEDPLFPFRKVVIKRYTTKTTSPRLLALAAKAHGISQRSYQPTALKSADMGAIAAEIAESETGSSLIESAKSETLIMDYLRRLADRKKAAQDNDDDEMEGGEDSDGDESDDDEEEEEEEATRGNDKEGSNRNNDSNRANKEQSVLAADRSDSAALEVDKETGRASEKKLEKERLPFADREEGHQQQEGGLSVGIPVEGAKSPKDDEGTEETLSSRNDHKHLAELVECAFQLTVPGDLETSSNPETPHSGATPTSAEIASSNVTMTATNAVTATTTTTTNNGDGEGTNAVVAVPVTASAAAGVEGQTGNSPSATNESELSSLSPSAPPSSSSHVLVTAYIITEYYKGPDLWQKVVELQEEKDKERELSRVGPSSGKSATLFSGTNSTAVTPIPSIIALFHSFTSAHNPDRDTLRMARSSASKRNSTAAAAAALALRTPSVATEPAVAIVDSLNSNSDCNVNPQQSCGILSEEQVREYFGQIALGVHFLHTNGVAHRDLSLGNFVLDFEGKVRILDFEMSIYLPKDESGEQIEYTPIENHCGTINFMSPEMYRFMLLQQQDLKRRRLQKQKYGPDESKYPADAVGDSRIRDILYNPFQGDIWSLGVVLFFLLVGEFPYEKPIKSISGILGNRRSLPGDPCYQYVVSGRVRDLLRSWRNNPGSRGKFQHTAFLSDESVNLIEALLKEKPAERLTIEQVVRHPWFKMNAVKKRAPAVTTSLAPARASAPTPTTTLTSTQKAPPSEEQSPSHTQTQTETRKETQIESISTDNTEPGAISSADGGVVEGAPHERGSGSGYIESDGFKTREGKQEMVESPGEQQQSSTHPGKEALPGNVPVSTTTPSPSTESEAAPAAPEQPDATVSGAKIDHSDRPSPIVVIHDSNKDKTICAEAADVEAARTDIGDGGMAVNGNADYANDMADIEEADVFGEKECVVDGGSADGGDGNDMRGLNSMADEDNEKLTRRTNTINSFISYFFSSLLLPSNNADDESSTKKSESKLGDADEMGKVGENGQYGEGGGSKVSEIDTKIAASSDSIAGQDSSTHVGKAAVAQAVASSGVFKQRSSVQHMQPPLLPKGAKMSAATQNARKVAIDAVLKKKFSTDRRVMTEGVHVRSTRSGSKGRRKGKGIMGMESIEEGRERNDSTPRREEYGLTSSSRSHGDLVNFPCVGLIEGQPDGSIHGKPCGLVSWKSAQANLGGCESRGLTALVGPSAVSSLSISSSAAESRRVAAAADLLASSPSAMQLHTRGRRSSSEAVPLNRDYVYETSPRPQPKMNESPDEFPPEATPTVLFPAQELSDNSSSSNIVAGGQTAVDMIDPVPSMSAADAIPPSSSLQATSLVPPGQRADKGIFMFKNYGKYHNYGTPDEGSGKLITEKSGGVVGSENDKVSKESKDGAFDQLNNPNGASPFSAAAARHSNCSPSLRLPESPGSLRREQEENGKEQGAGKVGYILGESLGIDENDGDFSMEQITSRRNRRSSSEAIPMKPFYPIPFSDRFENNPSEGSVVAAVPVTHADSNRGRPEIKTAVHSRIAVPTFVEHIRESSPVPPLLIKTNSNEVNADGNGGTGLDEDEGDFSIERVASRRDRRSSSEVVPLIPYPYVPKAVQTQIDLPPNLEPGAVGVAFHSSADGAGGYDSVNDETHFRLKKAFSENKRHNAPSDQAQIERADFSAFYQYGHTEQVMDFGAGFAPGNSETNRSSGDRDNKDK